MRYRGCRSKNLYYMADSMTETEVEKLALTDVKQGHLEIHDHIPYKFWRQIEFVGYILISFVIHVVMLVIGKTLLILEAIKNKFFR